MTPPTECTICGYAPLDEHATRPEWPNDDHYGICCTCAEYGYSWEPTDNCHECDAPRPFPIHADYSHMDFCCACAVKLYPERFGRDAPDCSEDHPWIEFRKRIGQEAYEAKIHAFNRALIAAREEARDDAS